MRSPTIGLGRALFVLALTLPACGQGQDQQAAGEGGVLNAAEFQKALAEKPGILVDVRTPDEWSEGVIEGAQLIDFHHPDIQEQLKSLDPSQPVYLYCAAGGRSYRAAQYLRGLGRTAIYELDGGMDAWREAGLPVVLPGSGGK